MSDKVTHTQTNTFVQRCCKSLGLVLCVRFIHKVYWCHHSHVQSPLGRRAQRHVLRRKRFHLDLGGGVTLTPRLARLTERRFRLFLGNYAHAQGGRASEGKSNTVSARHHGARVCTQNRTSPRRLQRQH
jgi:hypothetical protein